MKRKRIVYVQYTNPAAYPPLEHSARILAESGWEALMLGAGALGSGALRIENTDRIRVEQIPFQRPGWRQKLQFVYFNVWCLWKIARFQPRWIYCSEMFSAPFGRLMTALGASVIYHEHDSPQVRGAGAFERFLLQARASCARRSRACVIPNARRGEYLRDGARMESSPMVIWNCPRRQECSEMRTPIAPGALRLLYHGSIGPERLPLTVVDALAATAGDISLTVVGYETSGSKGHVERLRTRAVELGIANRLNVLGALPTREELLAVCRRHDAGLALMPKASSDVNVLHMEGASNKPFDYLACGLALIVSRLAAWERMFVAPGYAYSCDPDSPAELAGVFANLIRDPERTRAMGEAGRQRILTEWNYERQFRPLQDVIEGRNAVRPAMAQAAEADR